MATHKNSKRKSRKRKKNSGRTKAKTALSSLVLGALCACGLWRCLDEDPQSVLDPFDEQELARPIDVGQGNTPDPTLVHEHELLKQAQLEEAEATPLEKDEPDEPEQVAEPEKIQEETQDPAPFELHGVAFHFHTQIKSQPKPDSRVVGYLRRGAGFRLGPKLSTKGCPKGWYEIEPGDMFVCRGKGVIVSDEPVTFSPAPPPPDLDDDLPYAYAYAKENNTPEYWRIPTPDETEVVAEVFERLTARETKSHQLAEGNAAAQGATPTDARDAGAQDDAGSEETDRDPNPRAVAAVPVDGGVIDPFALPPFVHHRMAKGYYVSLADAITAGAIDYTRTVRGRYVQTEKLYTAKPSRFEGTLINADNPLPFVYMVGGGVKTLKQESSGGPLKNGVSVDRYSRLPYLGKMKRKRRSYVRVGENEFISARTAAVVEAATAPDDLMPGERWIDVSISQQTLVAYEGETPVFATLISSGRKGFETPLGTFRIYNKHVTITMDDPNAGEEAYSIEDVPWTQYFEEGYALHGAFWHNRFGRVRSHGCINLSPADARRLFFWTGPHLFESMHGIAATKTNPGTRVIVHP